MWTFGRPGPATRPERLSVRRLRVNPDPGRRLVLSVRRLRVNPDPGRRLVPNGRAGYGPAAGASASAPVPATITSDDIDLNGLSFEDLQCVEA